MTPERPNVAHKRMDLTNKNNLNFAKVSKDPEYKEYTDHFLLNYFKNFNNSITLYQQNWTNKLSSDFENISKKLNIVINLN